MPHKLESKADVDALLSAVKQSKIPLATIAGQAAVGTALEEQPAPAPVERSREVAPMVWARLESRLARAAKDPRHPAHLLAGGANVDGVRGMFRLRYLQGLSKYGTALHTHDGRNTYADAFQELVDAVFYAIKGEVEDGEARHLDTTLDAAIDHLIAALLMIANVVDADPAGPIVGRPRKRIPRETIEVAEQEEGAGPGKGLHVVEAEDVGNAGDGVAIGKGRFGPTSEGG